MRRFWRLTAFECSKIFRPWRMLLSLGLLLFCILGVNTETLSYSSLEDYQAYQHEVTNSDLLWARQMMDSAKEKSEGGLPLTQEDARNLEIAKKLLRYSQAVERYQQALLQPGAVQFYDYPSGKVKLNNFQKADIQQLQDQGPPPFRLQHTLNQLVKAMGALMAVLGIPIMLLMGTADIFTREHSTRVDRIIFSSQLRRRTVMLSKLSASTLYCMSLLGVSALAAYLIYGSRYDFTENLLLPIYSLPGYEVTLHNIKGLLYIGIELLYLILCSIVWSLLIMMVSSLTHHTPATVGFMSLFSFIGFMFTASNGWIRYSFARYLFIPYMNLEQFFTSKVEVALFGIWVNGLWAAAVILPAFALLFGFLTYKSFQRREVL